MFLIIATIISICQALPSGDRSFSSSLSEENNGGRIINGFEATRGQFPYMAGIMINGIIMTGGSLISANWILTCGHCTYFFEEFTVYLGAHQISAEEEGRLVVYTTDKYLSPTFTINTTETGTIIYNDVGMLKLPTSVTYSEWIQPAKLPTKSQVGEDFLGLTVRISGWGSTAYGAFNASNISDVLKYLDLTVISNSECDAFFDIDLVTDTVLCADSPGFDTVCMGDSGSPLILIEDGTQIGVTSFNGGEFCDNGGPQGFSRVADYLDWIQEMTGVVIP